MPLSNQWREHSTRSPPTRSALATACIFLQQALADLKAQLTQGDNNDLFRGSTLSAAPKSGLRSGLHVIHGIYIHTYTHTLYVCEVKLKQVPISF